MWIDYAVRKGITAPGAFVRLPVLLNAARTYRAHRIVLDADGIAPYKKWRPARSSQPSHLNFATGVDGVRYPREMVRYVAGRGTEFLDLTPRADDVWLNHCALRAGFPVQQVTARSANFPLVPGSQRVRLSRVNLSGGNDVQIAATYTAEDVAKLRAAE